MPSIALTWEGVGPTRRPSWAETFLALAKIVSLRATCDRLHAGCVIVTDEFEIVATGYNGSPRKMPHCDDVGHLMEDGHCVRTIHDAENALFQAARLGHRVKGCTIYLTNTPCHRCVMRLVQAGIKRIIYADDYRNDPRNIELTREAGVEYAKAA